MTTDYQFEKLDTLKLLPFNCRELLRAFEIFKEHSELKLAQLRIEERKDKASEFRLLEKTVFLERYIEKLNIGTDELNIILCLDSFCSIMDADRVRTRLQVVRLLIENKWLRLELTDLQKRLLKLENDVVTAEAEKQHYQFVYKMRNLRIIDETYAEYGTGGDDEEDTDPEEEVPAKIKAVHNLCMEYIREKRYEVALPLIQGNLAETKGKLGENNNDVATLYSIMGKIHKEQGNLAEAQDFYEKSFKLREKVLGKDNNATGITLTNLAHVLFKRNNFKDAEKYANQALKIREKTMGKTHVDVALLHAHLGTYYLHLEKWNECVNHYKIALGVYEQMFDCTDNLIMKGYSNMAKAYVHLKQNDKSAEMLALVCKSYQQKNSNESPLTVFQVAQQSAEGKGEPFTTEMLMKDFGSYENVIDKDILGTMVEYFLNMKKNDIAGILKEWGEASDKQPTAVVRPSMVAKTSKTSKKPSVVSSRKVSTTSQSSKKDKSSIVDYFKKNKK